jgi:hypothetical protein
MAYCPECGAEFQVGIRRCPECLVDLVEELDDPSLDEVQEQDLVPVKASVVAEEAKKIKKLLETNGILCVVESASVGKTAAATGPMQVLVNLKDESRSQQLIKNLLG